MKRSILSLVYLMIHWQSLAQDVGPLTVQVSNVNHLKGYMMIAVYDSEDTFLGKDLVQGAKIEVHSDTVRHVFEGLPHGDYAISVFHDVDSDGDLDTNFIGIPKEPYGFSNNDLNLFGAPSFSRSVFTHGQSGPVIQIRLKGG